MAELTEASSSLDLNGSEESFAAVKRNFRLDARHSEPWRRDAYRWFKFVAGDQWDPADKRKLAEQGRPAVTFNFTLAIMKVIAGLEINSRQEILYKEQPVATGFSQMAEHVTNASRYFAHISRADQAESKAWADAAKVGMGWVEVKLDYISHPKGVYSEKRINPLEMYWDYAARETALTDARRIWRVQRKSLEDAQALFPGFSEEELDARWADPWQYGLPEDAGSSSENYARSERRKDVRLVQLQWYELEPYWLVANPQTGAMEELSEEEYEVVKTRMDAVSSPLDGVRMLRKCYYQRFFGGVPLTEPEKVMNGERFSFYCITGEEDSEGLWYGFTKMLEDPQRWANKWLVQSMHILNTTAKGGIVAEEDAFADQREAEETYSRPDAITWVRPGALAAGKIQPKPGGVIQTGYMEMIKYAVDSMWRVTGINPEVMGMAMVDQPGVLEAQRKHAAMTLLAPLFESYKEFKYGIGKARLFLMQNYLADGRLIRIMKDGKPTDQWQQLLKENVEGEYEVWTDEAPSAPDIKAQIWAALMPVLPLMKDALSPQFLSVLLEYAPGVPPTLAEKIRQALSNVDPAAQAKEELQMKGAMAEVKLTEAKGMEIMARARAKQMEPELEAMKVQAGLQKEQIKADASLASKDNTPQS